MLMPRLMKRFTRVSMMIKKSFIYVTPAGFLTHTHTHTLTSQLCYIVSISGFMVLVESVVWVDVCVCLCAGVSACVRLCACVCAGTCVCACLHVRMPCFLLSPSQTGGVMSHRLVSTWTYECCRAQPCLGTIVMWPHLICSWEVQWLTVKTYGLMHSSMLMLKLWVFIKLYLYTAWWKLYGLNTGTV